jgi:hypothetical protein
LSPVPRPLLPGLLAIAVACFAIVLVVLLVAAITFRQPGTSGTGAVTLDTAQKITQLLGEAETDTATGNDVAALAAYQQVLALDATNVTALTQVGWFEFSAGSAGHNASLVTVGVGDLREAISLAPGSAAPRLYYAIAAYRTPGNRALALRQFRVFLTLNPSPAQLVSAAPYLRALHLAPG